MLKLKQMSWALVALALSGAALAQKPVIYPAKSQSAAQQQKDDGECYTWAKGNTGVDPAALAAAAPPASAPPPSGGPRAQKKQAEEAQAAKQKATQQQQQAMAGFYKAYGACMEGRGYTVK